MTTERRRARRILLNAPAIVQAVTHPPMKLHPNLESIYERVMPNEEMAGRKCEAVVRDISVGGAFLSGLALPLLSRIAFTFDLEGFGHIEAIGWTLWRRTQDCELPLGDDDSIVLPMGFGVLFEAIPMEARMAIHDRVG